MVRLWGRSSRSSAPRKRFVACSFWPFDRKKAQAGDLYRTNEPSEVFFHVAPGFADSSPMQLPQCANTFLQTHSKRSLHPSSRSASSRSGTRQKQLQATGSGLIDSEINLRDLSHLSFTRPAPKSSPAIHELLSKVRPKPLAGLPCLSMHSCTNNT